MKKSKNGYYCRAFDGVKVYDFYFAEGYLRQLRCYDDQTMKIKFEDICDPLNDQKISTENFETAFLAFCNFVDSNEIMEFFKQIKNDVELKNIARQILLKCSYRAAEKASFLAEVVWKLEREG